jgi:protein SMG8
LENNFATGHDDIQLFKDFIFRHYDALRGKGVYSSNATVGSAAGVGVVDVAAVAAASASAGRKTVSAPDLPGFDKWLCCAHRAICFNMTS